MNIWNHSHKSGPGRIVRSMRKLTASALLALAFVGAGFVSTVASATSDCPVVSQSSEQQTRQVTGMTAAPTHYGPIHKRVIHRKHHRRHVIYVRTVTRYTYSGTQSRTVATTTNQCEGSDPTVSSSATGWTGATIVRTVTVQRVR